MTKLDYLSFQTNKLKSLTPIIKRKQEDLKVLTDKIVILTKEDDKIKKELNARKTDLDETKELTNLTLLTSKRKHNTLKLEIKKLEKDNEKNIKLFSDDIQKNRNKINVLKEHIENLTKQIPTLKTEFKKVKLDKKETEKKLSEISTKMEEAKKITSLEELKFNKLIVKHEEEEKRLDIKLEEISLREAADRELHNTLVLHTRRINRAYQKLGKEKIVITI